MQYGFGCESSGSSLLWWQANHPLAERLNGKKKKKKKERINKFGLKKEENGKNKGREEKK